MLSRPPGGGVSNHATTQTFYYFQEFTQSIKDLDFHAKTLKLGENMSFTKSRTFFNDFTKSSTFFDAFTHDACKSIHGITHK